MSGAVVSTIVEGLPMEHEWDERTARVTPLGVACHRMFMASLSCDRATIERAIRDLATLTGDDPEDLIRAHERVVTLRSRGDIPVCCGSNIPASWWGSQAQALYLATVARCMGGCKVPPLAALALTPVPPGRLPRRAKGPEIVALAGRWCRENFRKIPDIETKVGLRVGGKNLTRRRVHQHQQRDTGGGCSLKLAARMMLAFAAVKARMCCVTRSLRSAAL